MHAPEGLKNVCITVLGSGYAPFASGTWGSLVALALFSVLWKLAAATTAPRALFELVLVAGIVIASWLSVAWGGWAIARFGRADPKPFVLDEFAGQWMSLLVLPAALSTDAWTLLCMAGGQFLIFRVADIIKPPPARQAELLPAGWGVLTDDLVAGLYANVVGQILWHATPLATWLGVRPTLYPA